MNDCEKIYELNQELDEIEFRGTNDIYIKTIEDNLKIEIFIHEHSIFLKKDDLRYEKMVLNIIKAMETLILNNISLTLNDIYSIINNIDDDNIDSIINISKER